MSLAHVSQGDPHVPAHNAERDAINDLEELVGGRIPFPAGATVGDLLRFDGISWKTTETRFFEGVGRPEGQVAAPIGSRYIDKEGALGGVEWVKKLGDGTTGWIVLAGDTGVRNIAGLIDKGNGTIHAAYVSRVQHTVDLYLDITMPTNRTTTWTPFAALPGFGPGYDRGAALQDNNERAAGSTLVKANGGLIIYGVEPGKRDKFSGTWSTRNSWPDPLPGLPTAIT